VFQKPPLSCKIPEALKSELLQEHCLQLFVYGCENFFPPKKDIKPMDLEIKC